MTALLAAHTLEVEQAVLQGPALAAALAGLGLVIGVLSGLFGVGGGFLTVPLLVSVLNIEPTMAVGSGFSMIVGASAAGVRRHGRAGNVDYRVIGLIGAGSVVGAVLGGWLHRWIKLGPAGGDERTFQMIVLALYVALLLATIALLLRPSRADDSRPGLMERLPLGPRIDLPSAGLLGASAPGLAATGLAVGVLTGLLGVGGGVLMVPVLIAVVGLDAKKAVGCSLGVVLLAGATGATVYGLAGQVNLWIVAALLVGTTFGVQIGAAICDAIGAGRLKQYFALVVAVALAIVIVKLTTLWR